ncbi:hypothetical protein, partial [Roseinatronobacter ekhonensis]|uniref:hypothetical protein n=1 Tax=Roseinatronobacter ekhonensis TaxID=254356 RepID=UPI001C7CA02E
MLRAVIVAIWSAVAGFGGFAHHNAQAQTISESYTPSPAEAEFVDLTAGFGTIQLLLMIRPDFLSSPARLELEAC